MSTLWEIPIELQHLILNNPIVGPISNPLLTWTDRGRQLSRRDWGQARLCCKALNTVIRPLIFCEISIRSSRFQVKGRLGTGKPYQTIEPNPEPIVHLLRTLAAQESPACFVRKLSVGELEFPYDFDTSVIRELVKAAMDSLVNLRSLKWTSTSTSPIHIEQVAFESLFALQSLEELELSSLRTHSSPPSLKNLQNLTVLAVSNHKNISAPIITLLVGCPNLSTLSLTGGANHASLRDIQAVFPSSLKELMLSNYHLDCSLRPGAWTSINSVNLRNCATSPAFWKNSSIAKLHMSKLDQPTVEYFASILPCLKELVAQQAVQTGVAETLFARVLPLHGRQLKKLLVGSPYNEPFTMESSMAKGLGHCENLDYLGVALSADHLQRFGESMVHDAVTPYEGPDSLITLMEFTAQYLPRLTTLEVQCAWPQGGLGGCGNAYDAYRGSLFKALARSLAHLVINDENQEHFQRLRVRIGHRLHTARMDTQGGSLKYIRDKASEMLAFELEMDPREKRRLRLLILRAEDSD